MLLTSGSANSAEEQLSQIDAPFAADRITISLANTERAVVRDEINLSKKNIATAARIPSVAHLSKATSQLFHKTYA